MSDEPRRDIEAIFEAARLKQPGSERASFVEEACGGDGELHRRVQALLAAHDRAGDYLDPPESRDELLGTVVGRYAVLDVLGEGGMGVVYLAEQKEPVRRRVALKVIKLGMDTKQVLHRFEAERQALAIMDDDNIAKVLDAGSTADGRPYFVMECVKGAPILEYCDQQRLDIAARLRLFRRVCAGVQHAHQKGVMHRDLKQSNVLVTTQGNTAVPKIIDFGLARATDHRLLTTTLYTEKGVLFGTPEYMSPEQAGFGSLDIDTRTDIYSLGVMLYELLVGALPLPSGDLRKAGLLEFHRRIREDDPPRPSTRLTALSERGPETAKSRSTDFRTLLRRLRGDLDWITLKALSKDRTRRYSTASAFAEDIRRHMDHEPVEAGPPTAAYRIKKFVRRYRLQVLAGAALFVALVGGAVGTTIGFVEARRERDRADHARRRVFDAVFAAELARLSVKPARKEAEARLAQLTQLADELSTGDVDVGAVSRTIFGMLPEVITAESNAVTPEKTELGRKLFYDERLSKGRAVSCNTCHVLDRYGVDGLRVATGAGGTKGRRNTPTVYNAAGQIAQFWDGRAANVEEQAKVPILSPHEMAMPDEASVVRTLSSIPGYVEAFAKAYPDDEVPLTFDNVARAIGAFVRKLVTPSRFDRFLDGDANALSSEEKAGLRKFVDLRCIMCHSGAYVGGQIFDKLGLIRPWPGIQDLGRYEHTKNDDHRFVFKVPSLRNVARTAPYLHNGLIKNLATVVTRMARYQLGMEITAEEAKSIVAFLEALTGDLPKGYVARPESPR